MFQFEKHCDNLYVGFLVESSCCIFSGKPLYFPTRGIGVLCGSAKTKCSANGLHFFTKGLKGGKMARPPAPQLLGNDIESSAGKGSEDVI